jgi:hypothetical protein
VREAERVERALWTVDEFSSAFPVAALAVAKALRASKIEPARANGTVRYHIRDLVDAVFLRDAGGNVDPERMDPYRRKAYLDGELNRLTLEQKAGRLLPVEELQAEEARAFKILARFAETAPDRLERDGVLSGPALLRFEEVLAAAMSELADELSRRDAPDGRKEAAA